MATKKRMRNFGLLYREIIKPGFCAVCGACEGVCPVNAIEIVNHTPKLVDRCINCGMCVDVCLRLNQRLSKSKETLDESDIIGKNVQIFKARSAIKEIQNIGQNGGVITSLLVAAFKNGDIDSAILTSLGKNIFLPKVIIANTINDIKSAARSKYAINPLLSKISAVRYSPKKKFAIVGLPCHLEALAHIIKNGYYKTTQKIEYKVGLFCMRSYYAEVVELIVSHETGLLPENILRTEIRSGEFVLETPDGTQIVPLKTLKDARAPGCKYCKDLTNFYADIAVGNLGVEDNSNVVIVRTQKGRELLNLAREKRLIEIETIDTKTKTQITNAIINVGKKKLKYSHDMPELTL